MSMPAAASAFVSASSRAFNSSGVGCGFVSSSVTTRFVSAARCTACGILISLYSAV